jgi:hypothetical protein
MSTTPPGSPGMPPEGTEPPPVETFTQYDQDKDAYHCSYGPVAPARTVHDPERGVFVRLDLHSNRVVGFSIPNFTAWHAEHATEDGGFEMDLPAVWPSETSGAESTAS